MFTVEDERDSNVDRFPRRKIYEHVTGISIDVAQQRTVAIAVPLLRDSGVKLVAFAVCWPQSGQRVHVTVPVTLLAGSKSSLLVIAQTKLTGHVCTNILRTRLKILANYVRSN